jgi:hypothetical protein
LKVERGELVCLLEEGGEAVGAKVAEGAAMGVLGAGLVGGEDPLAAGVGGRREENEGKRDER